MSLSGLDALWLMEVWGFCQKQHFHNTDGLTTDSLKTNDQDNNNFLLLTTCLLHYPQFNLATGGQHVASSGATKGFLLLFFSTDAVVLTS